MPRSFIPGLDKAKNWARQIKRDVITLWLAARDPRVGFAPRALAALIAAYALSPVDLIPDFIPVLGYLDDLLIVPAGIWLTMRLLPRDLLLELRAKAALIAEKPVSKAGMIMILALWLAMLWLAARLSWPR